MHEDSMIHTKYGFVPAKECYDLLKQKRLGGIISGGGTLHRATNVEYTTSVDVQITLKNGLVLTVDPDASFSIMTIGSLVAGQSYGKALTTEDYLAVVFGQDVWTTSVAQKTISIKGKKKVFTATAYLARLLGYYSAKYLYGDNLERAKVKYPEYKADVKMLARLIGTNPETHMKSILFLLGLEKGADFGVPRIIRQGSKKVFENFLYGMFSFGVTGFFSKNTIFPSQLQVMLSNYGLTSKIVHLNTMSKIYIPVDDEYSYKDFESFVVFLDVLKHFGKARALSSHIAMSATAAQGNVRSLQEYSPFVEDSSRNSVLWSRIVDVKTTKGSESGQYTFTLEGGEVPTEHGILRKYG